MVLYTIIENIHRTLCTSTIFASETNDLGNEHDKKNVCYFYILNGVFRNSEIIINLCTKNVNVKTQNDLTFNGNDNILWLGKS